VLIIGILSTQAKCVADGNEFQLLYNYFRPGLGPKFPPGSNIEQGGSARGRHKAHVKFLGAHRIEPGQPYGMPNNLVNGEREKCLSSLRPFFILFSADLFKKS
jgi:hypothetical protein